jgi:FlaA1/EpsC-like NDP-sugar epimerase
VAFRNESKMYPPDQDPETFYREQLFPQKARQDIAYFSQSTAVSDFLWIPRGFWYSVAGAVDWRGYARLRGPVFLLDLLALQLAWLAANLARFDGVPAGPHWDVLVTGLWLMPLVVLPLMALGGSYSGATRHYVVGDLVRLAASSLMGWTLAFHVLLAFFERNVAMGLLPIALLMALAMSLGVRVWQREQARRLQRVKHRSGHARIVVYGAGYRGATLAPMLEHGFPRTRVLGFLDDNLSSQSVAGMPILGAERDLDTVHAVHGIEQLWLTFEPESHKFNRLRGWCNRHGVKMVVLPEIRPFLDLSESPSGYFEADVALARRGVVGSLETESA